MTDIQIEELPKEKEPRAEIDPTVSPTAHLALADRFDVKPGDKNEEKKLAAVWEYAQSQTDSTETSDLMWEVMHLERVLGSTRVGESRLNRLYRYIKLKKQERNIQEELRRV